MLASADRTKLGYGVVRWLNEISYETLPVNPGTTVTGIRGTKLSNALRQINRAVDMVLAFRPKKEPYAFAEQAAEIRAKVLCGLFGVYDDKAAKLAEAASP